MQDLQLQPKSQSIDTTQLAKLAFSWTFGIEQALFSELLEQANNRKRADNGFKKEAWAAACTAVDAITSQRVTIEKCKAKAEAMKALWKEFE